MAINKVEYGNETLIDLTNDTVTEDNVLEGATFHSADGEERTGKVVVADVIDNLTSESSEDALSANQGRILNENKLAKGLENIDEVGIERIKEIAGESSVPENIVLHSPSEEEVEVPPIDADMLGGELPEYYENELYLANESTPSTPSPRDADTLGGQLPSYYAKQSVVEGINEALNIISTTHFHYAHFGSNSEIFEIGVYKRYTKTIDNIRKGVYLIMLANIVNESVSIADIDFYNVARAYCGGAAVFVGTPLMNLVRLENSFDININIQPRTNVTAFFQFDVFFIRIGD